MNWAHWPFQSGYFASSDAATLPAVIVNAAATATAAVELRSNMVILLALQSSHLGGSEQCHKRPSAGLIQLPHFNCRRRMVTVATTKKELTHGTSIDHRPDVSQRDDAICMHNPDCRRHRKGSGNCGPDYSGNSGLRSDVCRRILAPDGGMGNLGNGIE